MLNCIVSTDVGVAQIVRACTDIPAGALWVDLLDPTPAEEHAVERLLGIDVPTPEEMRDLESSRRLYEEDGALFLTLTVLIDQEGGRHATGAVTFILARNLLVTLRYADLVPLKAFAGQVERRGTACGSAVMLLEGLLEAVIEHLADVLQRLGQDLEAVSSSVFSAQTRARRADRMNRDLRAVMERIGLIGDGLSQTRESLVSQSRLLAFVQQSALAPMEEDLRGRYKSLTGDVAALSDHASFINGKISFILDATLGLINIEQNNIIKIFSVVSVIFTPPTLIASIYGMNFKLMPELDWSYGYPFAILLMTLSAVLPFLFFKRRGWL